MKYWMDDRLRMALLKEKAAYRDFWKEYDDERILAADREIREYYAMNPNPICGGRSGPDPNCSATTVLYDFFTGLCSFNIFFEGECPCGEDLKSALYVLNPFHEEVPDNLPFHFYVCPPVAQLVDFTDDPFAALDGKITPEHHYLLSTDLAVSHLQPWGRLLRIDLRRSKKDIMKDISCYLDRVAELRKKPVGWADNYKKWQPDVSREQKEAWRDLQIWRMRRGPRKKPFLQISRELGIKVDAAKKAFAQAYLLIEEHPLDGSHIKKRLKEVDLEELRRTCATCPEKPERGGTCKEPCPDVLAFIEQDQIRSFGRPTPPNIIANMAKNQVLSNKKKPSRK